MQIIKVNTGFEDLCFWGDHFHEGGDFYIKANCPLADVKYLLFFDSRGISASWETSLLKKLSVYLKSEAYLIIARPLELTTWATLINFIVSNKLNLACLLTNVGIVDYTPKRKILCLDMLLQVEHTIEKGKGCVMHPFEKYHLSCGQSETLFGIEYSLSYLNQMKTHMSMMPLISIKTPLVDPDIKIDRARPVSFFKQLYQTNKLIDSLKVRSIDLGYFDRDFTYDAVHWTPEGNDFVFSKILKYL
jgi:hypothetical protein